MLRRTTAYTSLARSLTHSLAGFLTALAPHWWLGLLGFLSFSAYEVAEYVKKRDTLYLEFREYAVGLYAGLLVRLICNLFFTFG